MLRIEVLELGMLITFRAKSLYARTKFWHCRVAPRI